MLLIFPIHWPAAFLIFPEIQVKIALSHLQHTKNDDDTLQKRRQMK